MTDAPPFDPAAAAAGLLAVLQPLVGREVHVSDWLTVTQNRIDQFAAATGDHQWIHVDPARAAHESPWRTTIAHGMLTLSLYAQLRHSGPAAQPWPAVRTVINYGLNRVRFTRPVKSNSRLRLRVTLAEVVPVPGAVQVEESCVFELDGDSTPACVASMLKRLYP